MMFTKIDRAPIELRSAKADYQDLTSSKLGSSLRAFVDVFETRTNYPPAIIALERKKPRKKRKPYHGVPEIGIWQDGDSLGRTSYHHLALRADKKSLRLLCSNARPQDLLCFDNYGKTPLHYAAKKNKIADMLCGQESIASFLEVPDAKGNTPLHIMARSEVFDFSLLKKLSAEELQMLLNIRNTKNISVLESLNIKDKRKLADLFGAVDKQKNDL